MAEGRRQNGKAKGRSGASRREAARNQARARRSARGAKLACPGCGAHVQRGATFCPQCGTLLATSDEHTKAFVVAGAQASLLDETSVLPAAQVAAAAVQEPDAEAPDATTLFEAVDGAEPLGGTAIDPNLTQALPAPVAKPAPKPQAGKKRGRKARKQAEAQQVREGSDAYYSAKKDPERKHRGRKVAVALLIVLLAAGIPVGSHFGYQAYKDMQAREAAAEPHTVYVELNAPGYNPETDSKFKMHVLGTDMLGQAVAKDVYISSSEDTFEVPMGQFQVSFDASPLMASGDVYDLPQPVPFEVVEDDTANPTVTLAFKVADQSQVSNEQVMAMFDTALASGMSEEDAIALRSGVLDKCERAQKALYNNPEAKAKAEADAKRKKEFHITTSDFEFDIPSEWWDQVEWKKVRRYGHTGIDIYLKGNETLVLCSVSCSNNPEDISAGGDVVSHQIGYKTLGNKYVDVWTTSYTYIAMDSEVSQQTNYTEAELRELIPVATGGAMTYEKAVKLAQKDYRSFEGEFQQRTLFASLVVT